MEHTTPITFPEDETFDVGQDTRTGVALLEYRYDVPFKFTGKIDKLTFKLNAGPDQVVHLRLKQVVEEHRFASTNTRHTFAQEKSIAAEAPALGDDHAFRTTLGDLNLGSDGVGLVQNVRAQRWPAQPVSSPE